jgi:hypothetical protein
MFVLPAEPVLAMPAEPMPVMPAQPVPAMPVMPAQAVTPYPPPPAPYNTAAPVVAATVVPDGEPFGSFAAGAAPMVAPTFPARGTRAGRGERREETSPFLHMIALLVLVLALGGVAVRDLLQPGKAPPQEEGIPIDRKPYIGIGYDFSKFYSPPKGGDSMRFGVWKIINPGDEKSDTKALTFDAQGRTNSTMVKIDGEVMEFGDQLRGWWTSTPKNIPPDHDHGKYGGSIATWGWPPGASKVRITQEVEKIPGDPFIEGGKLKRAIDTCLVKYTIENTDKDKDHTVALRVLWDTKIGVNDGVPFTVAGKSELVDESGDFRNPDSIPDFIQALEHPSLENPGVVVRLKLRNPGLETPERLSLTLWPAAGKDIKVIHEWEVPVASFKDLRDSAVVMYWNDRLLKAGGKRVLGFTYGLVHLAKGTGDISATYSGELALDKKITITALITAPKAGETLTLKLPDGLKLMGGIPEHAVPPAVGALATNPNPVSWNITATKTGNFKVTVISNQKRSVDLELSISATATIYGG